jgi:hypothetical protein
LDFGNGSENGAWGNEGGVRLRVVVHGEWCFGSRSTARGVEGVRLSVGRVGGVIGKSGGLAPAPSQPKEKIRT